MHRVSTRNKINCRHTRLYGYRDSIMKLHVVLIVLVVHAISEILAQKRCCFPDQFVIQKYITTGTVIEGVGPQATLEMGDVAFDFTNNRVAAHAVLTTMTSPPVDQEVIIIENTTEGSSWLAYPQQKKCSRVKSVEYPFHAPQCIPDDATYEGSIVFGDKGLTVDSWVVPNVVKVDGFYSITVDRDCILNGESIVGKMSVWGTNQQVVATSKFSNFTRGISDPDKYFKVPDYCK